jgi:hypothetical protein
MFLNLEFLGKDDLTNEDNLVFKVKKSKISLEICSESNFYKFKVKKGKKELKNVSVSDKKLGNNTPSIEIKSFYYNSQTKREEIIINLGYNGACCCIFFDMERIDVYFLNPIGEAAEEFIMFLDDFED